MPEFPASLTAAESLLGIGYWHYHLETGKTHWSDTVFSMLGYQPEEIDPQIELIAAAFNVLDQKAFSEAVQQTIQMGKPYQLERKISTMNGTTRLIRASGKAVLDSNDQVIEIIGTLQDVTVESDRLNSMIESQRLLEAVSSIARIGHWRLDLIDEELYWSDEVYRIHGYEPGEIRPELSTAITHYHPDDRGRIAAAVELSLSTGANLDFQARIILQTVQFVRCFRVAWCKRQKASIRLFLVYFRMFQTSLKYRNRG